MERILVHVGKNVCSRTCGNTDGKLIHMTAGIAHKEDVFTIDTGKKDNRLIVSYAAKSGSQNLVP